MTKVNFHIYYEIDKDEVKTVLRADECDPRGCCWRPWVGQKASQVPYTCTGGAELPPCGRVRGPDSAAEQSEENLTFLGTNWPFSREK